MALLTSNQGCKIGWNIYDDEAEAKAASAKAMDDADRLARQGYDFGYAWPGEIRHVTAHPEHGECWIVTIP